MRDKIKELLPLEKNNYRNKTVFFSKISMCLNFVFTFYNGFLALKYNSVWNKSICVYYLLLSSVRAVIIFSHKKYGFNGNDKSKRKIYLSTHLILVLVCISLVVPISDMLNNGRSYNYGSIPAITIATYTTYRVASSLVHFKRSRQNTDPLVAEMRTINFIDSLAAVLTLQDTLIATYGTADCEMRVISVWTSAAILDLILVITIISFFKPKESFD